ncbi:hypothetical protein CEXT_529511 [Caerostris extrusa]|uniref:Uncharacterized protein n=1 Tax=Caerostris extrusa TaxID=172846 RepID=A0AAV4SC85_CAEEX|nr:hypothetical protein CEXT_529511 [Caerostris extrusa]
MVRAEQTAALNLTRSLHVKARRRTVKPPGDRVPLEKARKTCHHGTLIPTDTTEFIHSGTLISFLLHHVQKERKTNLGNTFRLGAFGFCFGKVQLLRISEEF